MGSSPIVRPTPPRRRIGPRLAGMVLAALGLFAPQPGRAASYCVPYGPAAQICSLSAYPDALCNDGSPGTYYIRRATPDTGTWLFYLQGGGACDSDASCAARYAGSPLFTTSKGWRPDPQGILSPDPAINPVLARANVVEVHYCSSDYWSGARTARAAFNTRPAGESWNFHGRAIAVAAFRDIAARLPGARRILFAGSSAGGVGATITLHDLLTFAPPGVTTLLANDAGYALPIGGFDPKAPGDMSSRKPLEAMIAAGIAFWQGHGDTPCWRAAHTLHEQVECYDTSRLLSDGSISQAGFTAQALLDTAQLRLDHFGRGDRQDRAHRLYAAEFDCAMQQALRDGSSDRSVYAPQRFMHEMFVDDASFTSPNQFEGGVTLSASAALASWLGHPGRRRLYFGDALGVTCPPY